MINNINRIGKFTSSEIWKLTKKDRSGKGFGQIALTYIEEKKFEKQLGRSLSVESDARPLQWGKLNEAKAFELLGLEYTLTSDKTINHSSLSNWSGSPDGVKDGVVIDIKCPYTLKSFCQLYECYDKQTLIDYTTSGEAYYWQLVSNAILTDTNKAELIIYCPYQSELQSIRDNADLEGIKWISFASDDQLPYLIEGGYYKNIKVISLDIPNEDKQLLEDLTFKASVYLDGNKF